MTKEEYIESRVNQLRESLEEEFSRGDYDRYDLDYVIKNEGFMTCYRAYENNSLESDVFQVFRDIGASEEQTNMMIKISDKAEVAYEEDKEYVVG